MSLQNMTLVNGLPATSISILDRGFQFADGLFTTVAYRRGRLEYWDTHLQRLVAGCKTLGIVSPSPQQLLKEARSLTAQFTSAGAKNAVLKLTVTRGETERGYASAHSLSPNRVVSCFAWPTPFVPELRAARVDLSSVTLRSQPLLAGLKHLNRLEQVMARNLSQGLGLDECLLCDTRGHVISGSMTNVFVIKDHQVWTPELYSQGVSGVMRAVVLQRLKELGQRVQIRQIPYYACEAADEIFLTNSLVGVWSIGQLGKRVFTIGGSMASNLRDSLINDPPDGVPWIP